VYGKKNKRGCKKISQPLISIILLMNLLQNEGFVNLASVSPSKVYSEEAAISTVIFDNFKIVFH